MKKILNFLYVEDYRRDMTPKEITHRNNKLALICTIILLITFAIMAPIYAESIYRSDKFEIKYDEWTCPDRNCGFINRDAADYCGLCGTAKKSRRR